MIRNQWYAILESNEVPRNKPIGVTRMGEKLAASAERPAHGREADPGGCAGHRISTAAAGAD